MIITFKFVIKYSDNLFVKGLTKLTKDKYQHTLSSSSKQATITVSSLTQFKTVMSQGGVLS